MKGTFCRAPLLYKPHPSLGVVSSDPFPPTASGTWDCNTANVQITKGLPGSNHLTRNDRTGECGHVVSMFGCGHLLTFCLQKLPKKPRLGTIPLPPVDPHYNDGGPDGGDGNENFPGGGTNDHQSIEQRTALVQLAEGITSLALAKPKYIENSIQSEVSRIFTPLEIVLYINGLDNSQAVWLSQARVMATATPRIQRGNLAPRPSSWSIEEPNRKVC